MVPCCGNDDMIHGIFVSVSLAIDEWRWEPGGIDRDRGSEIKEDDLSFGKRDALEPLGARHGDADFTTRFLSRELDETDRTEVKRSIAPDQPADGLAQFLWCQERVDPGTGVEEVAGHGFQWFISQSASSNAGACGS